MEELSQSAKFLLLNPKGANISSTSQSEEV